MVLVEPTITVRVKGAVAWVPFTASCSPPGVVWKVSTTVRGSSRTRLGVGQAARVGRGQPQLQVGRVLVVGRDERAAGHAREVLDRRARGSWTGSAAWISCQVSAEAGSVPSCGSVAEPEKVMTSPTFQVVPAAGVVDGRRRRRCCRRVIVTVVGVGCPLAVGHPERAV